MKTRQNRKLQLNLSVLVRKEGRQYSSWCPELDVASCGDTVEEACANLHDAVDAYLTALAEEGELEKVLDERGVLSSRKNACDYTFLSPWQKTITVSA